MSITTTGDDHGELHAGWSQEESASPHVIGDQGGATRQTTFSAQASATSDLLIGTQVGVEGPFDSVGNVLDVTLAGDRVTTAAYDVDSAFLPVRDFPPVASGYEEAALDLVQRMYGAGGVTLPWDERGIVSAYYPLRGHNQGFTVDGLNLPYYQRGWGSSVTTDGSNVASWYWGASACPAYNFIRLTQGVYTKSVRPLLNPMVTGTNINYVAFRARLAASSLAQLRLSMQFPGAVETIMIAKLSRDAGTTGTIDIYGDYREQGAGTLTNVPSSTVSTGSLDMSKEIQFVIQFGFLTEGPGSTLRMKCYAYDPDATPVGAPTVVKTVDLTNAMRSAFVSNGSFIQASSAGSSGYRDLILSTAPSSLVYHYPEIVEPGTITESITKDFIGTVPTNVSMRPAIPAWSGSGSDYLKMLCAARGRQMRVEAGVLHVRDLGSADVIPVAGTVAPPVLSISAAGRARSVDVVARKSTESGGFSGAANFTASLSLTVRVNEESQHAIALPEGEHHVGQVAVTVTDNDGVPVAWSAMWGRGARYTPNIGLDGTLTLTIRGPKDSTGLGEGPWRITSVQVTNQGFFEDPHTIPLYTGAPEVMVTRDKGGTVDNPFLNTTADVFDRATWLTSSYGSPQVTLRFDVPASRRADFQVSQVVSYGWAHFRVMDVTHSRASSSVTAVWFTTAAELAAVWAGKTADEFAEFWAGRRALDVFLRPLWGPGTTEGDVFPLDDLFPLDDEFPGETVPAAPAPFVRAYPSESKWSK